MKRIGLVALALAGTAHAQVREGEPAFRSIYKELVETNTTLSAGSCTLAAERMAARLRAGGVTDITPFSVLDHPKDGGLVAVLPGRDPKLKPMLLLAHLDVVEAKRADWTRDPFTLVEENGKFYARGASDDKAMAAIWVDTLIRLKAAGAPPRTVKLALTCGEETTYAFNGAQYLSEHRRDLIDAAFALNEGGGGQEDASGKPVLLSMTVGEKAAQNYQLEVTNPGGHSSRPVKPNAIYQLAAALTRIGDHEFPVQFNPVTRAFFAGIAPSQGAQGQAMLALLKNPQNQAADAAVSANPTYHSMLRTTCVATLLDGGHANNALPQRATANINCRVFPGESVNAVRDTLVRVIGDPAVKITLVPPVRPTPGSPPLTPAILEPAVALAAKMFPGVPVVPTMSTGASDGIFLFAAGIPTYGVPGLFAGPDYNSIHGLNEYMGVKELLDGRDYLYALVRTYAGADTRR